MKRKDGYIIIDKNIKKLEVFNNDKFNSCMCKIEIENEEYFFKHEAIMERYMELFVEQIALFLKINTVHNDLAKFGEKTGIISKNYNKEHKPEIRLQGIVTKFLKEVIRKNEDLYLNYDYTYDLESIRWALLNYYKLEPNKNIYVTKIMDDLWNSFCLQILVGNKDLHLNNLTIIEDETPYLAPNYDFELCGLIDLESPQYSEGCFCLNAIIPKEDNFPVLSTINDFLDCLGEEETNRFKEYVEKLSSVRSMKFINEIEKQIEIPVEMKIRKYLLLKFQKNLLVLNTILKNREQRSRK